MSTPIGDRFGGLGGGGDTDRSRDGRKPDRKTSRFSLVGAVRRPPAVGVVLAMASFLAVFYHVVDVVGGATFLLMEVTAVVIVAVWLGGFLQERTALLLTGVGFALALGGYFLSVPPSARALFTVGRVVADVFALLSGLSVLRLLNAGAWALFLVPIPTFLATYLLVRRRYVGAATVAAATTGFFLLTGDADPWVGLAAAVGLTVAVGFAGLDASGMRGMLAQWDTLAVVIAVMVVTTTVVTAVPGAGSNPALPGGASPSVESSLVTNADSVGVLGSIRLSPEVRFTVQAESGEYWRVGSYDRYTGSGWVRTGDASPYTDSSLGGPPGESERLVQQVTVKSQLDAVPAAWKPVQLRGRVADTAQVTDHDGLRAGTTLLANDTYTVVSERPRATTRDLRRAGTDYPTAVSSRYTQLPSSTPDRVGERTTEVLQQADASNPYDAAVAIERYLERTKEYSLDVPNPQGNVADRFLFEMDAGYCVYYATTMVTMLRTQGVPARFVVGYTSGQQVAEDEWVVRGLDSHAWVEVYFPDHGWVRFDPTPAGPRQAAEQSAVDTARAEGAENVDVNGSEDSTYETATPTEAAGTTPTGQTPDIGAINPGQDEFGNVTGIATAGDGLTANVTQAGAGGGDGSGEDTVWTPTRDDVAVGAAALVGLIAGARRFGVTGRAKRTWWLLRQSRVDPATDAERAFRRLEYLAAVVYRPRRPGETPRQFVEALSRERFGERAQTVANAYEHARYGRGVDADEARDAIDAVDDLVRQHAPVLRRLGGAGKPS
ncbi:transglutaminase TgpA family protein [Halobaculum limi]|uniref:transglutaminase TgpA family protein n=1 Tax=Halobaculum limi TaxID=3031916 RepID=UPI0024056EB4|nr:transglutaminaseTgpA domain-containing protein [Halobaculum sp. YSMS11]